jgi:hypothetical protein
MVVVRRFRLAIRSALVACALVLAVFVPTTASAATVTGNATWFDALGQPYGGCGLPQSALDSQNFVALNVFNTPGNYSFSQRPLPAGDPRIGMWNNGHNCGRWVQVTIGDFCTGTNDGAPNQPFCRNGSFVADKYDGATLNMIVADSCADGNAWCRDDPNHLDLAHASLNKFLQNGVPVGDMDPAHWNNRHISWQFIPAPNFSGDINIGFLQSAQVWWGAASISHLPNGIHSVEYFQAGTWHAAQMDGDMGEAFILLPTVQAGTQFMIRVHDVTDALINNGRVYTFSLPASCQPQCNVPYTRVSYTTS